jgi:hypothetical protein
MTRQQLRQPLRLAGAVLTATTLLLSTPAWAGTAETPQNGPAPVASPALHSVGAAERQRPMPMQPMPMQDAMGQWKQMDARLDTMVKQMNRATGPARVDAMAAVITELVSQREQMHRMFEEMHPGAQQHGMNQPARGEMMPRGMGMGSSGSSAASAKMCVRPATPAPASSANGSSS